MKLFKSLIILAIITAALSIGVSANEDSRRASIEKLFTLTKQDQIIDQMFPQMKQLALRQFQQLKVSPDQSPILEKYYDQIFDIMKEEMSWDKMKEDFIQLYETVYTDQEIQDLIVFYESPTGRKMIEKMPSLVQQSLAISQKYTQRVLPKIQALTQKMIAEIRDQSTEGDGPENDQQ